ncbi:hypothetical protein [Agathobaculum sp. Marseille-P7918]|uniref:hypothetical protein n=1 Tax=Agathobaculum sp. Marseille-P7918 TaxID=2479843 RepID=UPI000F62F57F|nr:hypothetical protein [Agathobaculum sp. Marseille-P7918]
MAKSKVINTVLQLRDNMSGGLLKAARNAKKAGADIDDSMLSATRQVVAFKNKAVDGIKSFAKTATGVGVAGVTALTTAFLALDSATEEYRIAQGKLNTAYQAANLSATAARKSYRNFYAILGDTDTATEASQLLAELVENEKDVTTWTRIAAGAHGKWGDSLPIEGLIESSNETAKVGEVTGVLADALNWVGIMEDDFNDKLSACGSEAKRNKLIMDTLSSAYEGAATAFYENNKQVINARRNQATFSEVTAKLGDTSALVKNRLWEMFGAAEDGSYRGGSALEWLNQKADAFSSWVSGLDMDTLTTQFDQKFAGAVSKAKDALQWCKDNADELQGALKGLAKAFVTVQVVKFTADLISAGSTVWEFIKTVRKLISVKSLEAYCWVYSTAVVTANRVALLANKAVGAVRWLTDQTLTLMTNAVQWSVDTAAIVANKAALLAHKIVGGAVWLATQAAALGVASAAWVHNTAMMAVNKAGQLASAAASGIATGATAALTAAQWALNAAFVATPIGWVVLGLGAIVAAGVALYKNWDTVKNTATALWTKVKSVFGGIRDSITGAFDSAKSKVSGFFSWLDDKIESIPLLGSLYSGGKSALSWIGDQLTGKALGTSYWRGGLTRVNERGGEILNLPSGTQIIPHDVSARMAGGPQVTVQVQVMGNVIGNRQYADELGETIVEKILRALDNM